MEGLKMVKKWLGKGITSQQSITPLALFRVLFGFIMLVSIIRFASNGWIYEQYIKPEFFFTYYGFDWVQPLGEVGMYLLFAVMGMAALGIMLGYYYRIAATLFFFTFTYTELIDKTNYLNHYYFVSLVSFLLILVPANRYFSLDVLRKPEWRVDKVPAWTINIFKLQLGIVYFFAGVAKLNADWLFHAMPLKIWLPAHAHLPLIGGLLTYPETAYLFSWAGAIYDLTVAFFLLYSPTRIWAYMAVIAFHMMTWWLFQIGMFPFIMILSTLIFFSPAFHQEVINSMAKLWQKSVGRWFKSVNSPSPYAQIKKYTLSRPVSAAFSLFFAIYFLLQILLPFRYVLYPGNLFWNEEGYRFSWRVMLMEKAGYTTFRVHNKETGQTTMIANWEYLTPVQEKMMATQPDMILQFAHHLEEVFREKWRVKDVKVTATSYVTLNGRRSRLFVDPAVDLTEQKRGWAHKEWIIPFNTEPKYASR